jgi:hypothetical protein
MSADLHSVASASLSPETRSHGEEVVTVTTQQQPSIAQLAAAAGVSRRMIFLGLRVHREGCPELVRLVIDGTVTMNLAVELVTLFPNHDDQRVAMAEFSSLPARKWLEFVRLLERMSREKETPSKTAPKVGRLNEPKNGAVQTPPKTGALAMRLPSGADSKCHPDGRP